MDITHIFESKQLPMIKKRYYLLLVSLIAIISIGVSGKPYLKLGLTKARIIKPEPQIDYKNTPVNLFFRAADNTILDLTKYRGKVVFINFWASWCPTCREEMPSLNDLYKKLANNKNVVFITVDKDKDTSSARKYMKSMSYNFPVVREIVKTPKSIFPGELPTTVILNSKGKIIYQYSGQTDFSKPEFKSALEKALNKASGKAPKALNDSIFLQTRL